MTIQAGHTLQHYRLVEKIGEGGMGEVWLARDVRLERDVAVKILPAGFATNEQFRARFEREGKTISSLNHPNICTLFDIGSVPSTSSGQGDIHFLVMERIEGESLADRLSKGALPLDEVLEIGAQIASALAAAHKAGITHRDLKPDNVMLTRSGAKLLDFGLAKTATETAPPIDGLTSLPTQAKPLTTEGTILGTFQYMAPEQLEGTEADARTDIFALGAVLYEMATGKRAFEGKNKTSLIAAIVTAQPPPISSVLSMTPPALDHIVRKCLEKDPEDRWQSAGDVSGQLRWISKEGSQVGAAPAVVAARPERSNLPWALVVLLALTSIVLAAAFLARPETTSGVIRSSLNPPRETALIPFDLLGVALSPDGKRLAFPVNEPDGGRTIWIRDLSSMTAERLPETDGGSYPFWSPDGMHLGFFANGKLKRVDLRGGSPQDLADAPSGRGASWSAEGVILFAPNITTSIHSVPDTGGEATSLIPYDPAIETTQRWPHFLPDGKHFVYVSRAIGPDSGEFGQLMVASLDDPEPRVLIEHSTNAVYVEPGYLLYGRGADLMARPFDLGKLEVTGDAVPLVTAKLSYWEPKNFVVLTASNDGTIVYLPESTRPTVLQWYDRSGLPRETLGEAGFNFGARVSPDATKVAWVRGKPQSMQQDIWIRDLDFAREHRLTLESGGYGAPRWSRDSSVVAFECMPISMQDLCMKSLGSAGEIEVIYKSSDWNLLGSWMPDGRTLAFVEQNPETSNDIWLLDLDNPDSPTPLVRTRFSESLPELSPDGRWLAYASDETGRSEIYVREAKEASQQWQISVDGAREARWKGDGSELFFASTDGNVMAVSIQTSPVFRAGPPQALFVLPETPDFLTPLFEDVTPDGERFLLNLPTESRTSVNFHAIFNWTALLEE
jgi:serine/threonine protein kinase/Tol biopolymer transport system component